MNGIELAFDGRGNARVRRNGERPTITLAPGEAPEAVDAAEDVLVGAAETLRIFQRAGEVVRITELDREQRSAGLHREAGTVQLAPVGAVALTEAFDRLASWERTRDTPDGPQTRRVDCPGRIAAAYLSRAGEWRLPRLAGVIAAPILRPDGTVLDRAGYDAATGLYLVAGDWPTVRTSPSREDALDALALLAQPFAEFPFVAPEDRSVLLAAILTGLQRRLLPSAPLFGFTAPTMRTGKGAAAGAVAILATGKPAPAMAVSGDREEIRKATAAALREGHAVINLDNIEHPLGSPDLSRAITEAEYGDRLLGETRIIRLLTNMLWTATGNNLAFRGDLAVRVVMCRLDARMERPEERHFAIPDLPGYLLERRPRLIQAALTVLRAYHVAGRPDQSLAPWGGFGEWSATIRAALVWLGQADPCATRQHVIADDPDRERTGALLAAWHRVFEDRGVPVAEVIERTGADHDLREAVLAVAAAKADPRQPDSLRLAGWCRREQRRIVEGLALEKAAGPSRAGCWRVSRPDRRATSATFESFSGQEKTNGANADGPTHFERGKNPAEVANVAPAPTTSPTGQPGLGFEEPL